MFDKKTFVTVIVALIVFKVLDRLFLASAMDKFLPESYEAYED